LFTNEFYQRVRTYLTPDGVLGQWLHLYEIDDGLVLSVIRAVHQNFASYEVFLTADVDILIIASNRPTLPKPDWSVFSLPGIAKDLAHFRRITPEVLENARLVTREVLAPLIGDARGANSDFYPTLDLRTERTRYMKEFAKGFEGLSGSRFDIGAALTQQRILPTAETVSTLDITRVNALVLGARLRGGERPEPGNLQIGDRDFREAAERAQTLRDLMAANHPPADWRTFFTLVTDVEYDRHAGTMGWADEAWYAAVTRFLDQQRAPADCRLALRFMHAIATYDWPRAAEQVDALVRSRADGVVWINSDLFREAAAVALVHTGDAAKARTVLDRLAEYSGRKTGDLRVKLLEAHIGRIEKTRSSTR